MKQLQGRFELSKYSIYLILIGVFVVCAILSKNFLEQENLLNVLRQLTVITIVAYGAMMLIISGLIDLSCGAVLALSGVMAVVVYKGTGSMLLAVGVAIALGVFCNLINAIMVANFDVPPFIATLAMALMARGAVMMYTEGKTILQLGGFTTLGQGSYLGIPIPVLCLIVVTGIIWYLMTQTRFGRSLYAIGGNELAARASGINIRAEKYKAFLINGALVGFAGALFMSRVNSGLPNGAVGFELDAITAAIVGGTSFTGGIGTTFGTLAGSLIIGLLGNIMNLTSVNSYTQMIMKGAIIAIAVIYDVRNKRAKRARRILAEIPGATPVVKRLRWRIRRRK